MISSIYYYSSGCSFGQCIDSNLRTDKCIATEKTQLLKVREGEWAGLMEYLWVWSIGVILVHVVLELMWLVINTVHVCVVLTRMSDYRYIPHCN